MISEEGQKTQFARHYQQLEIDDRASWDTAQANYRRLIHVWHPDKFSRRPREQIHAQQRFIDLTKSYQALRDFYRSNHRLPFQSVRIAPQERRPSRANVQPAKEQTIDTSTLDSSVLSRDPAMRKRSPIPRGKIRKSLWLVAGASIMFMTATLFLILDRKQNQATAEIGREVLRDAPQSEFMPTSSEIRRSQTRGAFVKPTQ